MQGIHMKKSIKNSVSQVIITILAISLTNSVATIALANSSSCTNVFQLTKSVNKKYTRKSAKVNLEEIPSGIIMIGYESEYLITESAPILRDFGPPEDIISANKWLALKDQERVDWLKNKFKEKPEFATDAELRPLVPLPIKPRELVIDSTGNLEIVSNPMNSYKEWQEFVDFVVNRYGPGSQQAMISKPRSLAFPKDKSPETLKQSIEEHLGWLIYTNLRDMYAKLSSGFERYLLQPDKLTAQSFDHPFLGPMNKIKRDVLEQYLFKNANNLNYGGEFDLFVRKSDASFKYTGGPSYRPDVAGLKRFSWEIRNAHKDVKDLKMKVRRDIDAHLSDLSPYKAFAEVPAFDSIETFNKLPKYVQDTLIKLFPAKTNPKFAYSNMEKLSLETYRNFSLPLMSFDSLFNVFDKYLDVNKKSNLDDVKRARSNYLKKLIQVSQQLSINEISSDQAKATIMGELGRFVHESGISQLFDELALVLGSENVNPKGLKKAI